jgi:DNA-binding XRE family transcriptional regulator
MTYHAAMAKTPSQWPKGVKTADEVLDAALAADPQFAAEWERLALARMVATRLIAYRSENGISQRELARRLGISQPRVVELESGEKNPQIETLMKISATTGIEFAIDVVPAGKEPTLVRKSFQGARVHTYAGGSVLVAAR